MAQSQHLVMIGLGVEADAPPVDVQPVLPDGIHLRWAFRRETGFPWYGYFLFRRPSRESRRICLADALGGRHPGDLPDAALSLPTGTLQSDQPLRLTDDFPALSVLEVDFGGGRAWLSYALPAGDIASVVKVTIGFRESRRGNGSRVLVRARYGGIPVATQIASGNPGDIVRVDLAFDSIDEVAVLPIDEPTLPDGALINVCYVSVTANVWQGWQPVPHCPQPITLPLFHPDYPATGNSAVNEPAAQAEALGRILYGDPNPYAGAPFASMHDNLIALVAGGPPGPPMADPSRAADIAGVQTGPGGGTQPPTLSAMHPLDLVLLAAVHPAAAQMLGLYWIDRTAQPGVPYDYLIVSDTGGGNGGQPLKVLSGWVGGMSGYEGYIVSNKRVAPAPPLHSPTDPRAFNLPLGVIVAPGGPGQAAVDAVGLVGVRWVLPAASGKLLPESPVSYHLWREGLGNAGIPDPSTGLGEWLTKAGPILVGTPIYGPFTTPQYPADWPNFPMYRIDLIAGEGWYGYRSSGMDLFGRISPPSLSMPWHQWAPAPNPKPWYYVDPPSDAAIHPSAVRILDKAPPPPPVGVEASVLDPQDPYIIADAAYQAWRASLPAAVRSTLVGMRVRWRWTATQMRQAPDTKEFRIYYNPGTILPIPDAHVPTTWSERVHVTPYADAVSVAADGSERVYQIFLPVPGGTVFAAGVPLTPTTTDPIVYAHVGVSAADGAPHTPDAPQWMAGAWGNRPGNEGILGTPAKIYRVKRDRPDPPAVPPDAERVYASPADYHAHSYYTYRWVPLPNLRTHVYRAMDDSLFAADRARRPRPALSESDAAFFPNPGTEPRWNAVKRAQVANELNGLNGFPKTTEGEIQAKAAYRALSNDALRILAGLPGAETAFSQVTIKPLDAGDPATTNRPGPDNPSGFPIDANLRVFIDTLDGRSTNRYFYRAAYVDGAQNRSRLSLSGPPIWLPNVVPPRAPVLTSVVGGERTIAITWASNRERDLAAYQVYRANSDADARDLRAMTLVHIEPVAAGDPAARPASITWTDDPVLGLTNHWYAIIAVDDADNASARSRVGVGRAFDEVPPAAPVLIAEWTAAAPPADARLRWTSTDETRVERRVLGSLLWDSVGDWRPPGVHDETLPVQPTLSWRFRLRVRKTTGALTIGPAVPLNRL